MKGFAPLLALLALPAAAIDAKSITIDFVEHVISITRTDGTIKTFDWTSRLPLDESDRAAAQTELQAFYDNTIQRNSLPADDPDRLADPATPCAFWVSGNRITYRGTLVTVTLDGSGNPVLALAECRL